MSRMYIESTRPADQRVQEFKVTQIPDEDLVIEVNEEEEKVFKKIGQKG